MPPRPNRLRLPRSRKQLYRLLLAALVSGAFYLAAQIGQWEATEGVVVSVADGDTLTLATGREKIRIRLAGIDAPEKNQPYGLESKAALSNLCLQQHAKAEVRDHDRYGRMVAVVHCQEKNANAEQVRQGMAWVYDDYARQDTDLYAHQEAARQNKAGLWRDKKPTPPWEFRRGEKQ
jgi:endonuclease YncB( thermonuclease family)